MNLESINKEIAKNELKIIEDNNLMKDQKNFLETSMGKIINTAIDVGIRFLLPNVIENEVIDIKNTLINEGLKEGINKVIESSIDLGKSAIGIFTGNFESISQVQTAVEKGGIIDSLSSLIDIVLNKTSKKGIISKEKVNMIKQGKNIILDNISSNIESMLTDQVKSIEKLGTYNSNWNEYYINKNFEGMEREYEKMKKQLNKIIPLERTIQQSREIENLHNLIKNNGKNFNISKDKMQLAKKLV